MKYSDELIDEVLARNDIVDVIGEHVRLKRAGGSYTGLCPFHNEKSPSFNVSQTKQVYYCFGCHAGGNAITFLMAYHNYTFVEALKTLAERANITLPEEQLSEEQRAASERKANLLAIYKHAANFYYYRLTQETGRQGYAYLRGRGLTDATIKHFGLGYADKFGDSLYRYLKKKGYSDSLLNDSGLFKFDEKHGAGDRFWNRVMYPIMDERGRVIGFGGRVMGDGKPKYLNSPESFLFNKRRNLYALNFARSTKERYMILCEGYMDVITMHQAGFTNTVASLGTALTPEQCSLLRRFTGEALLLYDSDGAGTNAALRAIPLLKEAGIESRVVSLAPYKDPDEFIRGEGADALRMRLEGADDAFLFEIVQIAANYQRNDPASWTAFQRECAKKLASIEEELERGNYLEAVCARFGIPMDGMRRLVARTAAEGTSAALYRPKLSGRNDASEADDGLLTTQKLMLAYLASYPEAYEQTKTLIGAEDYLDPLCQKIAEALYRQIEAGRVSEAGLVAMFPDAEDESKAAAIFHTEIPVKSGAELDRAFTDTVLRLLRAGSEAELEKSAAGDVGALSRYIEKKKLLENLERGKGLHLPYKGQET